MALSRAAVPRFIGGSNVTISIQGANERSVNLFPENTLVGVKNQKILRPTEGMRQFARVVGQDDTRELFYQDGRAFACTGTQFVEIFSDGTVTVRGTIVYDGNKCTIVSNGSAGHQIGISAGLHVYIYDLVTDAFTDVTAFGSNNVEVSMLEFMDGYFFALQRDTRRVYYSALENGLVWDFTFGFIERSWGSDNISFIKRAGRQLWLVGTKTSEIWADNGNSTIPFAPIQGAFLDIGSIAPFAGVRDGQTITWLSSDERGANLVVRAVGYDAQAVSTPAIATKIQIEGDTFSGAESFVHQMGQHQFYWLHVPGLDTTPTFDFLEGEWHERAMWNSALGIWEPHVARCHMYAFDKNLVGVKENGVIYELSPLYRDNVLFVT